MLRKWNTILSAVLLVLLAAHGIIGSILLLGIGDVLIKQLARALFTLAAIHAVIGVVLTVQSCKVWRCTKTPYFKENKSFWLRRFSGLAIVILMCLHLVMFKQTQSDGNQVQILDMILQLLFVLSLWLHIVSNVKPMLVAFGCQVGKKRTAVIATIFSVVMLFCAVGMIVYYGG